MRAFRISYGGYYPNSYPGLEEHFNYPDQFPFLSYAAAEAARPAKAAKEDIREFKNYAHPPVPTFEIIEFEISNLDFYHHALSLGMYPSITTNLWRSEPWWKNFSGNTKQAWQLHTNEADRRLVEFFDVAADRVVQMKPGKFLNKYFSELLTARQIAFFAEWWTTGERPAATGTVKFATTEDEILKVYTDGPRSCMSSSPGVKAYAAGDLAIAYFVEEGTDKIRGRTLCWPEKKIYGRIYPSPENWDRDGFESRDACEGIRSALTNKLRDDGYVSIQENPTGFDGARMAVMPYDTHGKNGYVLMPYLDNSLNIRFDNEAGVFRIDAEGNIAPRETQGYQKFLEQTCSVCSKHEVIDHRNSSGVYESYEHFRHSSSSASVCHSCREDHTTQCEFTGTYLNESNAFVQVYRYVNDNPETAILGYALREAWQSATGKWYIRDYTTPVIAADGQQYADGEVFYSGETFQYYLTAADRKAAEKAYRARPSTESRPFDATKFAKAA